MAEAFVGVFLLVVVAGLLVGPTLIITILGGVAGKLLGNVLGAALASLGTAQKYHGGWSGAPPTPLHVLEWARPPDVAAALAELDDETIAGVLARLQPRFAQRVLARLPAGRIERVGYWLDRPQPFPRNAQAVLARKLRRRLGLVTEA